MRLRKAFPANFFRVGSHSGTGMMVTRAHDCYRHGTLTLLAALDYLEGQVLAHSTPRHRHHE